MVIRALIDLGILRQRVAILSQQGNDLKQLALILGGRFDQVA